MVDFIAQVFSVLDEPVSSVSFYHKTIISFTDSCIEAYFIACISRGEKTS